MMFQFPIDLVMLADEFNDDFLAPPIPQIDDAVLSAMQAEIPMTS